MKILLLTDLPPCEEYTAGLVLSAMARFVPAGSLCCFAVVNPTIPVRISPEFSGLPIEFHRKPNENWTWVPRRRPFGRGANAFVNAGERLTNAWSVNPLIDKAVAFAHAQGVDRIWAVLEGQTMIRMAEPVAERLGVPLHTHVWDPFSWWATANGLDPRTTNSVQAMLDRAVSRSKAVATASQPMADLYTERFGARALPVIASHPGGLAKTPPPKISSDGKLLIGMAGQFYAAAEWLSLLEAMRAANWTIAGREVHIVVMGPQRPPQMDERHITFLGWKTQAQAAEILSCCDLLYCPYPFNPAMREVSEFSFPSKLVLYLAAGRPIVFHGPDYSAPAAYVRRNECGLVADRLFPSAVYNAFERLITTPELYESSAESSKRAFAQDFTLISMQRAFSQFLDLGAPEDAVRVFDHSSPSPSRKDGLSAEIRSRSLPVVALKIGRAGRSLSRGAKRKLSRGATEVALRIPRLSALRTEIHSLYAEVADLRQRLASAQQTISELTGSSVRPEETFREVASAQIRLDATPSDLLQADDFYRGSRLLVFGRARLIARLPLLGINEQGALPAENENVVGVLNRDRGTFTYLPWGQDRGPAGENAGEVASNFEVNGLVMTLLRDAIWHGVDELVAVGDDLSDPEVSIQLHLATLLDKPVIVATSKSCTIPEAFVGDMAIRNLRLKVNPNSHASTSL